MKCQSRLWPARFICDRDAAYIVVFSSGTHKFMCREHREDLPVAEFILKVKPLTDKLKNFK